jgi:hypothetical protein
MKLNYSLWKNEFHFESQAKLLSLFEESFGAVVCMRVYRKVLRLALWRENCNGRVLCH